MPDTANSHQRARLISKERLYKNVVKTLNYDLPLSDPSIDSGVVTRHSNTHIGELATGDAQCPDQVRIEVIQSLWGGYGELVRLRFKQPHTKVDASVIVKHVALPQKAQHPKGWNTQLSHQRKVRSYEVETAWYQDYSQVYDERCPMPQGLYCHRSDGEWLIVMQDLQSLGFSQISEFDVLNDVSAYYTEKEEKQRNSCLKWLANFHAKHICSDTSSLRGLWESGTYWHLETRPDELSALHDEALKAQAASLNETLNNAPFATLVHGDAKLANFCFSHDDERAAAVDFQYVGRGCAMKDVALFMSSAVRPQDCQQLEKPLLDAYFSHLKLALTHYQPDIIPTEVEQAWRPLFCFAWADFHRFVKGWSPNHWKINPYTEQLTQRALTQLARS